MKYNVIAGIAFKDNTWMEFSCYDIDADTIHEAWMKTNLSIYRMLTDCVHCWQISVTLVQ